jgi:hypothetical protein
MVALCGYFTTTYFTMLDKNKIFIHEIKNNFYPNRLGRLNTSPQPDFQNMNIDRYCVRRHHAEHPFYANSYQTWEDVTLC